MHSIALKTWRRFTLVLGICFGGLGQAHAGLVTGAWDPAFGPFLPNLNWAVRAELLIPNGCSNQADGVYSTASGACAASGISVQNIWLRLYDTGADPNNFFGNNGLTPPNSAVWSLGPFAWTFNNVRVAGQQIVGFDATGAVVAQTVVSVSSVLYSFPGSAGGNLFSLAFMTNGPTLECLNCRQNLVDPAGTSSVFASNLGLTQFLTTFTDNAGTTPKFASGSGSPLGARLDQDGNYLGVSTSISGAVVSAVPVPGSLLLALTALGLLRPRRRRPG